MKKLQPSLEERNISREILVCCSQCGWPGSGKMPAGVRVTMEQGKTVLVGKLSYFPINTMLCSLCQEMESASRRWFVKAQAEYLDQIKLKKQMSDIK